MILGPCDRVRNWHVEGREIHIPLTQFDPLTVSFTYGGDTFPAMRYRDSKPYRAQVYVLPELPDVIASYGWPQEWNADGAHGPDRYIEAQVWSDDPLRVWLPARN